MRHPDCLGWLAAGACLLAMGEASAQTSMPGGKG